MELEGGIPALFLAAWRVAVTNVLSMTSSLTGKILCSAQESQPASGWHSCLGCGLIIKWDFIPRNSDSASLASFSQRCWSLSTSSTWFNSHRGKEKGWQCSPVITAESRHVSARGELRTLLQQVYVKRLLHHDGRRESGLTET